jgi:hypothetical protein
MRAKPPMMSAATASAQRPGSEALTWDRLLVGRIGELVAYRHQALHAPDLLHEAVAQYRGSGLPRTVTTPSATATMNLPGPRRSWCRMMSSVTSGEDLRVRAIEDSQHVGAADPADQATARVNHGQRCFTELKQFRAVATRYGKRERIYHGTVHVASIRIWLRDPRSMIHGTRPSRGRRPRRLRRCQVRRCAACTG